MNHLVEECSGNRNPTVLRLKVVGVYIDPLNRYVSDAIGGFMLEVAFDMFPVNIFYLKGNESRRKLTAEKCNIEEIIEVTEVFPWVPQTPITLS